MAPVSRMVGIEEGVTSHRKPRILAVLPRAAVAEAHDGSACADPAAYNRAMLHTLPRMLAPAVMERVTLLLNHVLDSEAVATERLRPHAGKALLIVAEGWPAWLPPPPHLAWRVTPAGLLEWCGAQGDVTPELRLEVSSVQPMRLLALLAQGQRPEVSISGDAKLASDVDWLMQNLRWDWASDLEQIFPAPLAAGLQAAGSALASGVNRAVQALGSLRAGWPGRTGA